MQPVEMQPEDALLASARQLGGGVPFIQPRDGRAADSGCRGGRAPNEPDAIEGGAERFYVGDIFVLTSASPRGQDMLSHAPGPNLSQNGLRPIIFHSALIYSVRLWYILFDSVIVCSALFRFNLSKVFSWTIPPDTWMLACHRM